LWPEIRSRELRPFGAFGSSPTFSSASFCQLALTLPGRRRGSDSSASGGTVSGSLTTLCANCDERNCAPHLSIGTRMTLLAFVQILLISTDIALLYGVIVAERQAADD